MEAIDLKENASISVPGNETRMSASSASTARSAKRS